MSRTLLVIDLPNLARKAFHIHGGRFTGADGRPTGTAYGLLGQTLAIARAAKATHIAGAIEAGGTTMRREIDPGYKRHRKPSPDGFFAEMELAIEAFAAMGWSVYRADGYEADDTIATLAVSAVAAGIERVEVGSADRDLFGVVTDRVGVLWTGGPTSEIDRHRITPDEVRARLGVAPDEVAAYKAIAGDASDGYGGVRGIGPDTAARLIATYHTLDELYANLDAVTPAGVRTKLVNGEADARRSYAIAWLRTEAPLTPAFEPEAGPLVPRDRERAIAYLRTAAMGSLITRLPGA
jgi:DNA polymerase-1